MLRKMKSLKGTSEVNVSLQCTACILPNSFLLFVDTVGISGQVEAGGSHILETINWFCQIVCLWAAGAVAHFIDGLTTVMAGGQELIHPQC